MLEERIRNLVLHRVRMERLMTISGRRDPSLSRTISTMRENHGQPWTVPKYFRSMPVSLVSASKTRCPTADCYISISIRIAIQMVLSIAVTISV